MHVVLEVARPGKVVHPTGREARITVVHDRDHRRGCDRPADREVERIFIGIIVDERQLSAEGAVRGRVQLNHECHLPSGRDNCVRGNVGHHAETSGDADRLQCQVGSSLILHGERPLQRIGRRSGAEVNAAAAVDDVAAAVENHNLRREYQITDAFNADTVGHHIFVGRIGQPDGQSRAGDGPDSAEVFPRNCGIDQIVRSQFLIDQDRAQRRDAIEHGVRHICRTIVMLQPCGGNTVHARSQSGEGPCGHRAAAATRLVVHVVLEVARSGIVVHIAGREARITVVHDRDHRRSNHRPADGEIKRVFIGVIGRKADRPAEAAGGGCVELQGETGRLTGLKCGGAKSGHDAEACRNADGAQRQRREARVLDHKALLQRSRQRGTAQIQCARSIHDWSRAGCDINLGSGGHLVCQPACLRWQSFPHDRIRGGQRIRLRNSQQMAHFVGEHRQQIDPRRSRSTTEELVVTAGIRIQIPAEAIRVDIHRDAVAHCIHQTEYTRRQIDNADVVVGDGQQRGGILARNLPPRQSFRHQRSQFRLG